MKVLAAATVWLRRIVDIALITLILVVLAGIVLGKLVPLTGRETEILRLMAGGYSNKEIANSLSVAEGTVKNHVSNILSKLGVRDRTRAMLKAFELGIV